MFADIVKLLVVTFVPLIVIFFAPVEFISKVGVLALFPAVNKTSTKLPLLKVYPESVVVLTFAAVPAAVVETTSQLWPQGPTQFPSPSTIRELFTANAPCVPGSIFTQDPPSRFKGSPIIFTSV